MPPEASAPWGPGDPPAIFLMGPTAAGKTELALALARWLPVELVSVDNTECSRRHEQVFEDRSNDAIEFIEPCRLRK